MKIYKKITFSILVMVGLMTVTSIEAASYTCNGQSTISTSYGNGIVYHSATYVSTSNFNPKFKSASSYTSNTYATGSVTKTEHDNKKICDVMAKIRIWYPSGANASGQKGALYEYTGGKVIQHY